MGLRTKLIVIPTVFALAAVFAMGNNMLPNNKEQGGSDNYVLSVKWEPPATVTSAPTRIELRVDGALLIGKNQRISPWGHTMTAEKGAHVSLAAWAPWGHTSYLDCVIMRNNRIVPRTGFDVRHTPGWVRCEA